MRPQNKEIFYSIAGCPELFEGEGIATYSCGDRPFRKTGCRVQESSTKHRHKIFTMAEAKLEVIFVMPRMCHLAVLKAISLPWSWPQQAGNDPSSGALFRLWKGPQTSLGSDEKIMFLRVSFCDEPLTHWGFSKLRTRIPLLKSDEFLVVPVSGSSQISILVVLSWESMSRMTRGRLSLPWEVQGPPGYSAKFLQIRLWNPRGSGTKLAESIAGP